MGQGDWFCRALMSTAMSRRGGTPKPNDRRDADLGLQWRPRRYRKDGFEPCPGWCGAMQVDDNLFDGRVIV